MLVKENQCARHLILFFNMNAFYYVPQLLTNFRNSLKGNILVHLLYSNICSTRLLSL